MDARTAVSKFIEDNRDLAVGGMHMHNNPMSLIREVIKQKKNIKTLSTSPSASINADLLIGSGLVSEILTSYVGFEHLGLAPSFRSSVESKKIRLRDVDEGFLVYGFRAGASSLAFMPFPDGIKSDLPKVSPDEYKYAKDPFTGKDVLCARSVQPDVAFIHCQKADEFGNAIFEGSVFTDLDMLKASDKVVIQAEEIVPHEFILKHPKKTSVPAFLVDAVVHVPFGCHPTSSHSYYTYDEDHLKIYLESAKTDISTYIKEYVLECESNEEYLEKIGGRDKIQKLMGV
jgi:glutaconate CoA-transferase subunit A